jgi:hypothetical protein
MRNIKTVILKGREARNDLSEPRERNTSVAHSTDSSFCSTVATQSRRKRTTLTATFEFLELPKDMEDEFYRDNARIFLKGEQERIIHEEKSKHLSRK